jgi:hypothetical protein
VPFDGIDVDHVLISESGVFAVETKFTSVEWSERSAGFRDALLVAHKRARTIRLYLQSRGHRVEVTPVLVLWGPGAPNLDGGYEFFDDVLACRGSSPKAWIAHLEGLPHTFERGTVQEMAAVVDERVRVAASHG